VKTQPAFARPLAPFCVAACAAFFAACPGPKQPEPGLPKCTITPPQTTESSLAKDQAAKLSVTFSGVAPSATYTNKELAQVKATYQAMSDKIASCNMLFQSITCVNQQSPNSELAMKLAENVSALCKPPTSVVQTAGNNSVVVNGTSNVVNQKSSAGATDAGRAP
jgi:hypothetical protein